MVHVPRTAGDSLTQSVYGRPIGHFTLQDLLFVAPQEVASLPRFAVVRNPWSRLVSAWSFAREGGGTGKHAVKMSHPERYYALASMTFEEFVHRWLEVRPLLDLDGAFHLSRNISGSIAFDHFGSPRCSVNQLAGISTSRWCNSSA